MTFFVVCFGIVVLISTKCWLDDRARRRRIKPGTTSELGRYEEFEATARDMIRALSSSSAEREHRMRRFYKDHPPPQTRPADLERVLRHG